MICAAMLQAALETGAAQLQPHIPTAARLSDCGRDQG